MATPFPINFAAIWSTTSGLPSILSRIVLKGCLVLRSFTISTAKKSPRPRTSPTEGCFAFKASSLPRERRLNGFGAARGEEEFLKTRGKHFQQFSAQARPGSRGIGRHYVSEFP